MFRTKEEWPPVVKNLIIINVAMYVLTLAVALILHFNLENLLGLHSVKSPDFHFYQFVTHMFMHEAFGGAIFGLFAFPLHILFNMYALFMFGRIMENFWGGKKFLVFYMLCGLGAAAINMVVSAIMGHPDGTMIGASGAVVGVVVAFAYLFPNTEMMIIPLPIPIKAKYLIPLYLAYELFSGISNSAGDNVAHFAHLGGALIGFITVWAWQKDRNNFY